MARPSLEMVSHSSRRWLTIVLPFEEVVGHPLRVVGLISHPFIGGEGGQTTTSHSHECAQLPLGGEWWSTNHPTLRGGRTTPEPSTVIASLLEPLRGGCSTLLTIERWSHHTLRVADYHHQRVRRVVNQPNPLRVRGWSTTLRGGIANIIFFFFIILLLT